MHDRVENLRFRLFPELRGREVTESMPVEPEQEQVRLVPVEAEEPDLDLHHGARRGRARPRAEELIEAFERRLFPEIRGCD